MDSRQQFATPCAARPIMRAKRVLIFEPAWNGHHLQYVRMLIEALEDYAEEICVVLGRGALDSSEFRTHLSQYSNSTQIRLHAEIPPSPSDSFLSIAARSLVALRNALRRHPSERAYLPYSDGLLQVLGLSVALGARRMMPLVPIEALLMRGGFAYPISSDKQRIRFDVLYRMAALAPIERLHILDPLVFREVERRGGRLGKVAGVIPEAVEPLPPIAKTEARARLGVPPEGRYVVCAGALDTRKGVDLLLRAALRATLPDDVKVLLVGSIADDLKPTWKQAKAVLGEKLVTIDRYVNEEDFANAILASDVVAVPYRFHQGSSGVLVRAAAANRMVLASDYGWIGWATRTFGLGVAADVTNLEELSRALDESIKHCSSFTLSPAAARFVMYHVAENQKLHWRRGLARSLGRSSDVSMSWDEVVRGRSAEVGEQ